MGKGSSGGGTNTVQTQSAPPQQYLNAYSNATRRAQSVANAPYQQYTGSLLAGFTPMQEQAFGEIAGAQGLAQPYISQAANYMQNAGQPITITPFSSGQVNQYLSPYTQDVTQSLQNLFNQQNATQLSQVAGNAAAQGAYGGDREAVAAALTAGQQQAQESPVLSQTLQQGYNTALGEFNAQQQAALQAQEATGWLQQGAGYGLANLGQEALGSALTGAQAELGAGGQQQQLNQQALNIPYEEFQAQQAYPFQTTGWLANIAEGLGGASGGNSSTQYPGPSIGSQILGGGLAGAGLLGMTGAFGGTGYLTGSGGLLSGLFGSGAADYGGGSAVTGASWLGSALGTGLDFAANRGGSIPTRQSGGATTALSTSPAAGLAVPPDVSVSIVPNATSPTHGMGIPNPPQDPALANQNLSPMQIVQALGMLKNLGVTPNASAAPAASARGGRAVGGPAPMHFPLTTPSRDLSGASEFNYAPTFSASGQPTGMRMVGPNYHAAPLTLPIGGSGRFDRGDVHGGALGARPDMTDQYREPGIGLQTPHPIIEGSRYPASVFGSAGTPAPSETPSVGISAPLAALLAQHNLPVAAIGGSVEPTTMPGEGFQAGGSPGASLLAAGQAATGGANPLMTGLVQQYLSLPSEKLQELAMRAPPNSPYGAAIQLALRQKHMNPGAGIAPLGNAPVAPAAPGPAQGFTAPPPAGTQQVPTPAPPTLGQRSGGRVGYQGGGDIDPFGGMYSFDPFGGSEPVTRGQGFSAQTTMPPASSAMPIPALPAQPNTDAEEAYFGLLHKPPPSATPAPLAQPPAQAPQVPQPRPAPQMHPAMDSGLTAPPPSGAAPLNNPGNIRPIGATSGFMSYPTPQAGIQAIDKNLLTYQDVHGINTIAGVISRWAPPSENDTGRLILQASERTGYAPDQPIDLHDPLVLANVRHAIIDQEQGGPAPGGKGLATPLPSSDTGDQVVRPGQGGLLASDIANLRREAADIRSGADMPQHERPWTASPWMALLATGAGMMASRSPFPGVAIGEGLETGVKTAEAGEQEDQRRALEEARAGTIEMQARHMADMADMAQQRINETTQYHAQESQARDEALGVRESAAESLERQREMTDTYRQQAQALAANKGTWGTTTVHQDPNDPKSPLGVYFYPSVQDPSKPTQPMFVPIQGTHGPNTAGQPRPTTPAQIESAVHARMEEKQNAWRLEHQNDPTPPAMPDFRRQAEAEIRSSMGVTPQPSGTAPATPAPTGATPTPQAGVQHPDRIQGANLFRWNGQQYQYAGPAQQQAAAP